MSTWHQQGLAGNGMYELNGHLPLRDSLQLSKKYPSTKVLQNELELCKEQLGQWEVRAVAAEAEVTSLGFQKVTMEQEISKYKEKVKDLNNQLEAEKDKNRKQSKEVLQKIARIRGVMDELRKSEKEAKDGLEGVKRLAEQLKSGVISQGSFLSQVETLFACVNSRKTLPRNGKILKTAQSFDEKLPSTMPPLQSTFFKSKLSSQEEEEPVADVIETLKGAAISSPSPPPIPPRGAEQPNESSPSEPKKPIPPPRKLISQPRRASSPSALSSSPQRKSSKDSSQNPPLRKRLSSRVDSLYSLAPPPGTPVTPDPPVGGFVLRSMAMQWSLDDSTESEESDFETFTPPSKNHSLSNITIPRPESPLTSVFSLANRVKPVKTTNTEALSKEILSGESLAKKDSSQDESSTSQSSPKQVNDKEEASAIKKSSPIMTKRPVWFKRDSMQSMKSASVLNDGQKLKRRSRSMDAMMQRSVSSPVDQFRGQPVALSDGEEESTGGSCGYSKPFQHIRRIQDLINARSVASNDSLEKLFNNPNAWHRYDNDSEEREEDEIYYINPQDVESSSHAPKPTRTFSPSLVDSTYLELSNPSTPQRRIGISVHAATPICPPEHSASPILGLVSSLRDGRGLSLDLATRSGFTSDATTDSNEGDSEDNIYERPDDDREVSPLFDNQLYGSNKYATTQDDIYAEIDEVREDYPPMISSSVPPLIGRDHGASPLKRAFESQGDGMQNEDGYARVRDPVKPSPEQAPLLPPRPPNFMRVRSGNPARTVPGIGSLPRYTTLGGSEHQVRLVPLSQTSSWRQTEALDNLPMSSSLPNTLKSPSPPSSTFRRPKKSLVDSRATAQPNLLRSRQFEEGPPPELPGASSAFHTPLPLSSSTSSALRVGAQPRCSTMPSGMLSKTKKASSTSTPVLLEKSGWLTFHEVKAKRKKRWIMLKGTELKVYRSNKDRKPPREIIDLDKCCKCSINNGTEIKLDMSDKVYQLVTVSDKEGTAWLKVIEAAMQKVNVASDSSEEAGRAPTTLLSGWARVEGMSKPVWCFLEGHTLTLAPEQGAEAIRELNMEQCSVKCKKDSILMDESTSNLKAMVLNIRNRETRLVTILQPTTANIEEWCYIFNSLRCGDEGPELTRTERYLSEVMKDNPITHLDHPKWSNPIFKVAAMPLHDSLISMPTAELKELAKSLFRDLQRFMNKTLDSSSVEFHVSLVQKIVGQCLTHSKLQNEIYCQLLRQMSGHTTPTANPVLQGWLLLFILIPMFLPSRRIVFWYLTTFLERSISSKSPIICELAKNCQSRVKLCSSSGSRQCTPTFFELKALFKEFITTPLTPPTGEMKTGVYLSDGSMHEVVFYPTTTVSDLIAQLTEKVGLADSASTGFALMCDWPGVSDEVLCCPFLESKVCDVISMWTLSMEELNQHSQVMNLQQRNIRFTYKRRLTFQTRRGSESSYECTLLAYQISKDVLMGIHPTSSTKQALQLAAMMAQLEYGDYESLAEGERGRFTREAVERFCPWKLTYMALEYELLQLQTDLIGNWQELAGKSRDECASQYLSLAQTWPVCGAAMFRAEHHSGASGPLQSVYLAIHESGVSLLKQKSMDVIKLYSYNDISTFGGHGEDDFMLVVTPKEALTEGTTEKLLLSMDKIQICEATFLMATYIECLKKVGSSEQQ